MAAYFLGGQDTLLNALQVPTHLFLTAPLRGRHSYCPQFPEAEMMDGEVIS